MTQNDNTVDQDSSVFVGRLPVFDRQMQFKAYELMYLGEPDRATARFEDFSIIQTMHLASDVVGLEQLVGQ